MSALDDVVIYDNKDARKEAIKELINLYKEVNDYEKELAALRLEIKRLKEAVEDAGNIILLQLKDKTALQWMTYPNIDRFKKWLSKYGAKDETN